MKPTADMLTSILHNFRVNGRFNQDQLIIGRGVDEQLQLMLTDTIGIRYVPNNGSDPKLEYTNDGTTWYPFGASGSTSIEYEPIEFDQSYLSSDGKITIQHNFNDKNVLCLGYTPQPKEIEYLDNQLVLDYSDQNGSNFNGAVWFVNSKQDMLASGEGDDVTGSIPTRIYVNTSGNPYGSEYNEANGWYVLDDTIKDNVTVDPDNPLDYRNRTWRRTTDTGYEFVIQYTPTGTSWYIVCVKHPSVMYEYDLYMSTSPANATSPWQITEWEDRNMGRTWQNIVTLDDPNTT